MNLLLIFILVLYIEQSLCYIGCKFDMSSGTPLAGQYACILEANETVTNSDAYNLRGYHKNEEYNDLTVNYILIQYLDVVNIPTNLFNRFENADRFACENTTLKELKYDFFANSSKVTVFWLKNNQIEKINKDFLKDAAIKVDRIYIGSNKISDLSRNAFGNLIKLNILKVDNNNLSFIRNGTFNQLVKLHELNLTKNHIEFFEIDAFEGLSNLQNLDLDSNKIKQLNRNIFKPLTGLNFLSLKNNALSYVDNYLFMHLPNLKNLYMQNNRLKSLSVPIASNLKRIDVSFNQIDAIQAINLELLPQFQELYASDNLCVHRIISDITKNIAALNECFAYHRTPNCRYYTDKHFGVTCEALNYFDGDDDLPIGVTPEDIEFVKIEKFDERFSLGLLTRKFPNLKRLSIRNTQLVHVLQQTLDCKDIKVIDMRNNNLTSTKGDVFVDCHVLHELILIQNNIQELHENFFNGLWDVRFVDMSFNHLKDDDLIYINVNLTKIQKLYLSGNKFTTLMDMSFGLMGNLKILKLNDNKIYKISKNALVSQIKLKELHLQHNGIDQIDFLDGLNKLIYLNLEGNRLTAINTDLPKKLQYIDMSFNEIEIIDISKVAEMKNLNDLILSKNICVDLWINDIKFHSKNLTTLLQSCSMNKSH